MAANQFVNPGSGDFHLKAGADAINAGTDLSVNFTDDIDTQTRPIAGVWEIGADETSAAAIPDISGTVFEDINGDAQSGDFTGRNAVTVRLFRDGIDGLADGADDTFVTSTTTLVGGTYSFTNQTPGTYWVVVDSKTITPNAGTAAPSSVWADQTYGIAGAMDGPASFLGVAGALYGGRNPSVSRAQSRVDASD